MIEGIPALDVVTMGETMMAFEALEPGPLRESSLFRKWIGGAEDNFIIGLARLGFRCGWFSRLGRDEFGLEIRNTIRGEGVDTSRVVVDDHAQTGVFFVEPATEGDPRCFYYRSVSAAAHLSPEDIDPDYIRKARLVYLTGITPAVSDSARSAVEAIFSLARENKQPIVFDPNLRLKMWSIEAARRVLIPLMQQSAYALPGESELIRLMDCRRLDEAIEKAHGLGIRRLVIKQGPEGALSAVAGEPRVRAQAFSVPHPASTMGAGDCFNAGFVAGLLQGRDMEECLRWGNALGRFNLLGRGPYQTLPDYDEFMAFLVGEARINR